MDPSPSPVHPPQSESAPPSPEGVTVATTPSPYHSCLSPPPPNISLIATDPPNLHFESTILSPKIEAATTTIAGSIPNRHRPKSQYHHRCLPFSPPISRRTTNTTIAPALPSPIATTVTASHRHPSPSPPISLSLYSLSTVAQNSVCSAFRNPKSAATTNETISLFSPPFFSPAAATTIFSSSPDGRRWLGSRELRWIGKGKWGKRTKAKRGASAMFLLDNRLKGD